MQQTKPLLVLNASAGSGKTFNLVRNYLRLLLTNSENRAEMSQIIAMTFTNKAAIEMKNRIVADLNKIVRKDDAHAKFRKELAEFIEVSEEDLLKNARLALKKMLHQYEDFHVLTIDKFNLRLIRSFSRDLNLPEQFDIALDEDEILEKAVDELLNRIDAKEKNNIYELCLRYVKSNFDEENRWNIKKALLESSKILKNEKYFDAIKRLQDFEFDEATRDHLNISLETILNEGKQLQSQFKRDLEADDPELEKVYYKQGSINRWLKFANDRLDAKLFIELYNSISSFEKSLIKTNDKTDIGRMLESGLRFQNFLEDRCPEVLELHLKINYFYLLAILKQLAISMDEIRTKEATIRISEFNKLISDLVKDEEAPFIYERLGNRFSHFFLDEFQDTSRLQWLNLVPLVHESLGRNNFNFIVGDPKQSIYRFKNGVAEQFVSLPAIYNPENDDNLEKKSNYFRDMGQVDGLSENWRSAKEIVQFNNRLFEDMRLNLKEITRDFYAQVSQNPRGKDGGLVTVKFDLIEDKTTDQYLKEMELWVADCIADGYKPTDICILGRTKKDCNSYANHLKSLGYSVVSSDSLLVGSDLYVQLIYRFLKWRQQFQQDQLGMLFVENYFQLFEPEKAYDLYEQCLGRKNNKTVLDKQQFLQLSGLPEELIYGNFPTIFALIKYFLRTTGINELSNAYVHQLLDLAYDFDLKQGPDLQNFLSALDRQGLESNVALPDNEHAIQIMTAHKSKGLEFPVVIIPRCEFESNSHKKSNILLELNEGMIQTNLKKEHDIIPEIEQLSTVENAAKYTDALNLMYVAFTRPIDRLYVYHQYKERKSNKKNEDSNHLSEHIIETLYDLFPEGQSETGFNLTLGSKPVIAHEHTQSADSFIPVSLGETLWFPDISLQSTEEEETSRISKQQRMGNEFHYLMEHAKNQDEAKTWCDRGIRKGVVDAEHTHELLQLTEKAFQDPVLQEILLGGEQLDERTIMIGENDRLRPDKLIVNGENVRVIDFKTGEVLAKHEKQVMMYCNFLKEIGYTQVEGYLYYAGGVGLKKIR